MRTIRSGIFFFGLSLFVIWESLRVGLGTAKVPGAGFISFCVGIILAFLSLLLIYQSWRLREPKKQLPIRVVLALAALYAYSLVLNTLGFIVATFFLVALLFHLGEARRWWVLLGMSALVTLLAYLVFGRLLHVYFPQGILGI
jgi:putative tricarboxylic transport membrane protein